MDTISLSEHQARMRVSFVDGAPGVLVSASVWLAAGMVALQMGASHAVWTLLIGGAFIHPISVLVLKLMGRDSTPSRGNPLNGLAMASTVWLIVGCVLAYGLYTIKPNWFFPAMMLVIGSRYLAFEIMFGRRLYWLLGGVLIVAGYLCAAAKFEPATSALVGGGIELALGVALSVRARRRAA